MSIQSEAALRSGGTSGGRKQQTVATGQSQTNIQIAGANAPAVGALAPLVMPVPNLESANTLTQAIAAVNGFGTTFAAAGAYVAKDRQSIEADQFRTGTKMYETWVATREKASLEKNYDANQRAALGDTNAAISGNINAALSALPEGNARSHFSALITKNIAGSLAPYANERTALETESLIKGFGQQQMSLITNGASAEERSSIFSSTVNSIVSVGNVGAGKSLDDVATVLVDSVLRQSAAAGGNFDTDIAPMLSGYPDVLASSKIKHQALAQDVREVETLRISNAKQDAAKAGGSLRQQSDSLYRNMVPRTEIADYLIKAVSERGATMTRAQLSDVDYEFMDLQGSDPRRAVWEQLWDRAGNNESDKFAEDAVTMFVSGQVTPGDYHTTIAGAVALYDTTKSPGRQPAGAIDGNTYTKLLLQTKDHYRQVGEQEAARDLALGRVEPNRTAFEAAGIDSKDYLHPVVIAAANYNRYLPSDTAMAMVSDAMRGNPDAIRQLAIHSQDGVMLKTDNFSAPEDQYIANLVNSGGLLLALDKNGQPTKSTVDAIKNEVAFARSTPSLAADVDNALETRALSKIEFITPANAIGTDSRTRVLSTIKSQIEGSTVAAFHNSRYQNLNPLNFWGGETGWGNEHEEDMGLSYAKGELSDEVYHEVLQRISMGNKTVTQNELGPIIDQAILTVGAKYEIMRVGGRATNVVLLNQTDITDEYPAAAIEEAANEALKTLKLDSENVESIFPYGFDEKSKKMIYTIRMKSEDGQFPKLIHVTTEGVVPTEVPGVPTDLETNIFIREEAAKQVETVKITDALLPEATRAAEEANAMAAGAAKEANARATRAAEEANAMAAGAAEETNAMAAGAAEEANARAARDRGVDVLLGSKAGQKILAMNAPPEYIAAQAKVLFSGMPTPNLIYASEERLKLLGYFGRTPGSGLLRRDQSVDTILVRMYKKSTAKAISILTETPLTSEQIEVVRSTDPKLADALTDYYRRNKRK